MRASKSMNIRPRKVLLAPCWFYKLYGRIAAGKGEGACDAFIQKSLEKCAGKEFSLCSAWENRLADSRRRGVMMIKELNESTAQLEKIPPVANQWQGEVAAIRTATRDARERKLHQLKFRNASAMISDINEKIISGNSRLRNGIETMRRGTALKLLSFVQGVRSSKKNDLKEYRDQRPISFSDKPMEDYLNARGAGDEAIRSAVRRYING